jgi:hypothetical protein
VTTEEAAEEGTYFVDQSGHYYYQATSDQQPVMTVVSGRKQKCVCHNYVRLEEIFAWSGLYVHK